MTDDSKLKTAIISGLIATALFTFFLQPLISIGWSIAQDSGLHFYLSFSDRIYSGAALGYRNEVERDFYALFSGVAFAIPCLLTVLLFLLKRPAAVNSVLVFARNRIAALVLSLLEVLLIVVLFWFAVNFTLDTTYVFASTELNASFQQRLNILRPYMSGQEENLLISAWASMQNETDYQKINTQLEKQAASNNVKLPRVLWPDVLWSVFAWR